MIDQIPILPISFGYYTQPVMPPVQEPFVQCCNPFMQNSFNFSIFNPFAYNYQNYSNFWTYSPFISSVYEYQDYNTYNYPVYNYQNYDNCWTSNPFISPIYEYQNYNTYDFSNYNFPNFSYDLSYKKPRTINGKGLSKLAQIALNEVGTRENGRSNDSVGVRKYKHGAVNNNPWCASFTSWCVEQALGKDMPFSYTASSQRIKRQAEKAGKYANKNSGYTPKVGDLAVWTNTDDPEHGHVGVITGVTSNSVKVTEGNTSSGSVKTNTYSIDKLNSTARFNGYVKMNEWVA